jgi:hypothetical protein
VVVVSTGWIALRHWGTKACETITRDDETLV